MHKVARERRIVRAVALLLAAGFAGSITSSYIATRLLLSDAFLERLADPTGAHINVEALASSEPSDAPAPGNLHPQLFCSSCGPASPQPPPKAPPEVNPPVRDQLPRTTLRLELVATMESSDPSASMAIIAGLGHGPSAAYTAQDQLAQHVAVISVERSRVILRNDGQLEYLPLAGSEPLPPPQSRAKAPGRRRPKPTPAPSPETHDGVQCSGDSCTVARHVRDRFLQQPQLLAKQAKVGVAKRDGRAIGYRVRRLKKNSLLAAMGLKKGDVLTAVNGNALDSLDGVIALYQKLRRANHITVTLERGGQTLDKQVRFESRSS